MSTMNSLTSVAREAPDRFLLLVVGPVALAAIQLLNSVVNGFPLALSLAFAAVMVAFAVLSAQHARSTIRLQRVTAESGDWSSAD